MNYLRLESERTSEFRREFRNPERQKVVADRIAWLEKEAELLAQNRRAFIQEEKKHPLCRPDDPVECHQRQIELDQACAHIHEENAACYNRIAERLENWVRELGTEEFSLLRPSIDNIRAGLSFFNIRLEISGNIGRIQWRPFWLDYVAWLDWVAKRK